MEILADPVGAAVLPTLVTQPLVVPVARRVPVSGGVPGVVTTVVDSERGVRADLWVERILATAPGHPRVRHPTAALSGLRAARERCRPEAGGGRRGAACVGVAAIGSGRRGRSCPPRPECVAVAGASEEEVLLRVVLVELIHEPRSQVFQRVGLAVLAQIGVVLVVVVAVAAHVHAATPRAAGDRTTHQGFSLKRWKSE